MGDMLYHDENGISSLVQSILSKIDEYKMIVDQLENLVNRVNSSNDWVDAELKTAFISQCQTYITCYRSFISSLSNYVKGYLSGKSSELANIERAYS